MHLAWKILFRDGEHINNITIKRLSIKSQSTIQTCLSMCILALLKYRGIKSKNNEEINILVEGLKFTKIDYATGHLVYIGRNYKVKIAQYIDHPIFYKLLSKYKYPKTVSLINEKIDKRLINKMKDQLPFIIYIDQYYLAGLHLPHFVILEKISSDKATILDPWDGKRKVLPTPTFFRAIQSLRNKLKISPKLIVLGSFGA